MDPSSYGINTGGGGFSGSSGVSGDDKQSSGRQKFGGIKLGDFGSRTGAGDNQTMLIVAAIVAALFIMFMMTKKG